MQDKALARDENHVLVMWHRRLSHVDIGKSPYLWAYDLSCNFITK